MIEYSYAPLDWSARSLAVALVALSSTSALAQSFDCAKATPPIETAICASTELRAQDNALAGVYGRALYALRDDAPQLDAMRAAQRKWIGERNRSCAQDPARISACLAQAYRTRLATIAQIVAQQSPVVPAFQTTPPAQPPDAQTKPPVAATDAAPQPNAAPAPAPQPAQRAVATPAPLAVVMQPNSVAADHDASALVTIPAPARYAIRAQSATGVAIQVVDMIAGPGDIAGAAGVRDGRLDLLLDKGVYKVRTFGAKGAKGQANLTAEAYRDLAPAASLAGDHPQSGDLGDLGQRSYWIDVDSTGRVAVEAIGRALQDLRLWRNGEDLVDISSAVSTIETKAGRPMTRARLEGKVEGGRYLVTAYGGESIVWPDGSTDKPFMIRRLATASLAAGVVEGTIGAFGSLRFEAPAGVDAFRIETAQPAPLRMLVRRGSVVAGAMIAKNSRDPFATTRLAAGKEAAIVEISGLEGQAFRVRALHEQNDLRIAGVGPQMVTVDVAGEGGDEIPATALLVRFDRDGKSRVLASDAPRIGAGMAWRGRFNLRGPSTLLFEMTSPGAVAIRAQGPAVRTNIEPVLGSTPPRADGRTPSVWNLDAGVYLLRLTPVNNSSGALDLTFGQPGQSPDLVRSPASRSALSLGLLQAERGVSYEAITNNAPELLIGVRAIASPVDLSKGPLAIWQGLKAANVDTPAPAPQPNIAPPAPKPVVPAPGPQRQGAVVPPARPQPVRTAAPAQPATPRPAVAPAQVAPAAPPAPTSIAPTSGDTVLTLRAPLGGAIVVRDQRGADIPFSISDEKTDAKSRTFTLRISGTGAARALGIAWRENSPPQTIAPTGAGKPLETIAAGVPRYFDLGDGERKEFRIEAKDGGLYRVETLGRLMTRVAIGTSFLPRIGEGEDNGPGHNGLAQAYLRAGAYRVIVSAKDSAGRVGLTATPAQMRTTGVLTPNGSVRATLADGRGAIAPIDIREAGLYRLDLYGLEQEFSARLEDADGWPLTAPGPISRLDVKLEPGRYRLVVPPVDLDARIVARLRPVVTPAALEGHGPHLLPFDDEQKFQWREPQAKESPRTPDAWTFDLKGEANVDLSISEGMIGEIFRDKESVGKVAAGRPFSGKFAAGAYRVEARALGRDDRLDYTISLSADELQPDAPRFVDLPAKLDFAIAEDRVVNLTTFGRKDLKGVLKDANGAIVERLAGRVDDWNIALSRRLPAGRYTLALNAMTKDPTPIDEAAPDDQPEDSDSAEETSTESNQTAQADDDKRVEVRLALPAETDAAPLTADGSGNVSGPQVHRFALPQAPQGSLALVAARSTAELVLSIERREADGTWRVVGFERGQAPLVAWPAAADTKAQWRASVWSIDGASAPVAIVARNVSRESHDSGDLALEPLALEPVGMKPRIGLARAPSAAIVNVATASDALLAGSAEGHLLSRAESGPLAPQSDRLWFVARDETLDRVKAPALAWKGEAIALSLDAGEMGLLPQPAIPSGKARVWRARSAFGQPGLDAGHGMGIADNAAIALDGGKPVRVWNAGGADALRVDLDLVDLALAPKMQANGEIALLLPPHSAQPIGLSDGDKKIEIDLARDTAAFGGPGDVAGLAVAAMGEAVSRTTTSNAKEIWLANLGASPQPVRLSFTPGKADNVTADRVAKRFFGAAGSIAVRVEAAKGDVLRVEGAETTFASQSGYVLRGSTLTLDGPGEVALDYKPGLVAVWLERAGASAWPKAQAQALSAPSSLKMDGAAMAFALKQDQPALIGVRTSAPVILALEQGGRRELKAFAAGADFHRYVGAGEATLTIYSPHDGSLSGSLDYSATPITPAKDGLGDPVALAPGGSVLFGFEVKRAAEIGIGVRAEPDRVEAQLLDSSGKPIGEGLAQIVKLQPGRYIVEARVPVDAPATVVRPAIIGLDPPPAGPPPEEIEKYLAKAGLKTNAHAQ